MIAPSAHYSGCLVVRSFCPAVLRVTNVAGCGAIGPVSNVDFVPLLGNAKSPSGKHTLM